MFETFSDRARGVVFFSRKLAGQRGAAAIELEHVIEALVLEDQADYAKLLPDISAPGAAVWQLSPHRPFFTAEVAAEIQRGLEPLMRAQAEALPTSLDMPVSDAALRVLRGAKELGEELRGPAMPSRIQVQPVEPLHLLAVALSDESSATAGVLKGAGIAKESVISAIKSGEYS